jgi:acyl carrier protein
MAPVGAPERNGAILNQEIETIEQQVCALLVHYLEPRWAEEPRNRIEVTGATNLTSDLTLDSFQIMEFLMEVEDEFDIAIDMNSLSDVHTVSDLAGVVAGQLGS